jgi:SAM-dependent methyltransferase
MTEDEEELDYEEARAAELQAICDQQFNEYLTKRELYSVAFSKFPSHEANVISTEARRFRQYESPTLSYGEIEFESFGSLLCSLTKYGVDMSHMLSFVDLGSGTGTAVICAALTNVFEKCTGIEIIEELYKTSGQILKGFYKHCHSINEVVNIEYVLGDATFLDWSKGDLVFAHATCFDVATMARISKTASHMKSGAVIIVLSNRLQQEELFTLVLTGEVKTSWGAATALVYMRNQVQAPGSQEDVMAHLDLVLNREIPF